MWLIVVSLVLGVLIGYFNLLPTKLIKFTDYLTLGGLFLLLFTMGIKLGVNPKVVKNLDKLGLEAMVLALGSIIGSVLLLLLFKFSVSKEEEEGC